jgi:hypothetical protein
MKQNTLEHKHVYEAVQSKVKFQVNLEQATKTQKGSTVIALFFLYLRRKTGVGGQHHALAALAPGKRPDTHYIGG